MKFSLTLLITLMLSLCSTIQAQINYRYQIPQPRMDDWEIEDLRQVAVDTFWLYQMFNKLALSDHQLDAMAVVKDGKLVLEHYFEDNKVDKPHDMRSVSKSIRALLMGIAIDQGFIESLDDPISKYLGEKRPKKNLDPRKNEITIAHLLSMSTGWDCDDWNKKSKGQEDKVYRKADWIQYTLDLPLLNNPGEESAYCSMGVVIAAEIISKASGLTIADFAYQYLFKPMGIHEVRWGHTADKYVIPSGKRLYMTPRDMAKIGQLILNKGKWKEDQLVPAEWLENMTTPKTTIGGVPYGYLWWKMPISVKDKTYQVDLATGNGGQYIMVLPELKLVATFTGRAYNSKNDKLPFAILKDILIPSFQEE